MADIEELIVRIKAAGVEQVSAALAQVEAKTQGAAEGVRKTGAATKEASHEFGLFRSPVLEALFAVRAFTTEIHETVAALGEISGVQVAAEYRHIANGLDQVTHSAKMTKEMMEQIEDMQTPYLNPALMNAIPQIVTAGTPASQAVGQLKDLSNMAALGNLDNSQFSGFVDQMERMRQMAHPEIRSLTEFGGIPITDIVNKAQGTKFTTANQADAYLQQLNGEQAYQVLLKGAHAMGATAAAAMLLNDPLMAWSKTLETIHDIMKPTGDLFLTVLIPAIQKLMAFTKTLEKINELSNGWAGMLAVTILVIRSWTLLTETMKAVKRFTNELTLAVEQYGEGVKFATKQTEAANMINGALGGKGAVEKEGAEAAEKIAARGFVPWLKGIPDAIKGIKVAELAPKILKGALKMGDIVGFAASLGIGAIGAGMTDAQGNQTKAGAVVSGMGNGLGWGALGMLLGPEIGIPSAIIGAIIGGGMAAHGYKKSDEHKDALNKNTDALQANTVAMSGRMVGGGDRSRRVIGQIEVEYSVARMIAQGVA